MRALVPILLLLFANAAFGEAIVGKTRILVEGCTPYWVPLTGGAVEPIYWKPSDFNVSCNQTDAISAAYDGERFLINFGGLEAGIFAEGASTPLSTIELDENAMMSSSLTEWDGTRYISVWRGSAGRFASLRGAAVTRAGAIDDRFEISNSQRIAGLAVNKGKVLVLDAPGQPGPLDLPVDLRVKATVLDEQLTPRHSFIVDEVEDGFLLFPDGGMVVDVLDVVPFGDGFYMAWTDAHLSFGQMDPEAIIRGTRITADGTMLDVTPSMNGRHIARNAPSRDVDLVMVGQHLMAVVKREDDGPLFAAFIDKNGLVVGSRVLMPQRPYDLEVETVRMPDGTLALLARERFGFVATVTPLNVTVPLPRRRAVR